ncbi:Poly [ADP-ribose] polymerase 2 [Abeliophyllum distichum]|uniref:Poly [ADP-ribose] polymerase n=1 Tax=Abeliophyllum distichum TaxID=126358 RepID=A0ABD1SG38_9LAMI
MATSTLTVDELRAQLAQRNIGTTGTKPTLVRRLEAAIREESKKSAESDNDSDVNRKRQRDSDTKDSDCDAPMKIKAVDKSRSMNVKQLREQAALRGISTAGTKKEILERLCADVNENSSVNDQENDSVVNRKRQRDSDSKDSDCDSPIKIKAIDRFQSMNVKQLREQATLQGISTAGTKKEILERLCADVNENSSNNEQASKEESKKEKMVTAIHKGSAVLDTWLPEHIKTQFHVLQVGDEIYDAMLNQTNVGANNNKFYVIQILESDDGGKFMVYNRWGRVGVKGQDKLNGPYISQQAAISEFEQKFFDKTKNHWSNRKEFVTYPRSYTWLEMDYSETEKEPAVREECKPTMKIEPRESKLEASIAKFISLICNVSMMKQQMMEIGYNAEKLPLGKLSKSTILKGYDVLKRIADVISKSDRKMLEQLSGEFYTVIPHDFGFKKMGQFIIDTPQKLKSKLEMVEALGEIELATKLLADDIELEDPLYSHYQRLHCELVPLEVGSREFFMIEKYMKNTHAKTHSGYTADIVQVFKVSREGEAERFEKFSKTKNRILLWHGSRLTNWTGILSQGLRIAPPEAPVTGYMFGKGVYFADMFSKSANYCCSSPTATSSVLLLCEVALGDMAELLVGNYNADKLPEGKLSTKGVGATAPDISKAEMLEDGLVVPLGKPKEQPRPKGSLLYNEYIVYNVDQIRMRISAVVTRRGYAAASSQSSVSSSVRGGASNVMMKKGEKESTKTSWVPDPVTGYYRPENQTKEIDAAELRENLLKNKIRQR